MTTRSPSAVQQRGSPRASVGLIGSATPSRPASRPSTATSITVWPSPRSSSAPRAERAGVDAQLLEQAGVAQRYPAAARPCRSTPLPVSERNSRDRRPARAPRSSAPADDRRGQRMFAAPLQAGRQAQQLVLGHAAAGSTVDQPRLALRQRAGLVHHQRVDLLQHLQRLGVLDQHAVLARPRPIADHDRHRRGQAQRAGAGDDQHGDRVDQRVGQPRLGARQTPRPTNVSSRDHAAPPGTNQADDLVGQPLDRGAAALGLADHADDLRQQRVARRPARPASGSCRCR